MLSSPSYSLPRLPLMRIASRQLLPSPLLLIKQYRPQQLTRCKCIPRNAEVDGRRSVPQPACLEIASASTLGACPGYQGKL